MGFDAGKAGREISDTFKFVRVGDGFKMEITDVDDTVEIEHRENNGPLLGIKRFLAVKGIILGCVGGDVDDDDKVTDTPVGEERGVLLQYEYKATGKESFAPKPSPITKAVARAITAVGSSSIQVGGELRLKHNELGPKNKENPSWNRPKFYEASYTAPVRSSAVVGASVDADEPFLSIGIADVGHGYRDAWF